jgi:hypothetical protein
LARDVLSALHADNDIDLPRLLALIKAMSS